MLQFDGYICSIKTPTEIRLKGSEGIVRMQDKSLNFTFDGNTVTFATTEPWLMQLAALEGLFALNPSSKFLTANSLNEFLKSKISKNGMVIRQLFYQLPYLWHHNPNTDFAPEAWTATQDVTHPVRPKIKTDQLLYTRFCPTLNKRLSFRVANVEKDLDTFTAWQNQARVNVFWELAKPKEELHDYLTKGLQDPHQIPVIYEINGEPVGYFEFYWVKENRLGPYYESDAFDRGFHLLVGNSQYLGFKNTDMMLKSVVHCLLLEDPRTRKIMAEPRYDNVAILKYIETFVAWKKLKEFDFPHKRAALLECRRERFFLGDYL